MPLDMDFEKEQVKIMRGYKVKPFYITLITALVLGAYSLLTFFMSLAANPALGFLMLIIMGGITVGVSFLVHYLVKLDCSYKLLHIYYTQKMLGMNMKEENRMDYNPPAPEPSATPNRKTGNRW